VYLFCHCEEQSVAKLVGERASLSPTRIIVRDRNSIGVTIRSRSGITSPSARNDRIRE